MYDIIIIGAGPAGISAAIYAVSRGKNTLVLEKASVGGLIGKVSTVTHYSGIIKGETGDTFARRMKEQALEAGVEIRYENVEKVSLDNAVKTISTAHSVYETKKVILANGTTPVKLDIPGAAALTGHGMAMNAAAHGEAYRKKNVYVVGGADGAVKEALYLADMADRVTIIHFEDTLVAIPEFKKKVEAAANIDLRPHTRLTAVYGENQVEELQLTDEHTGQKENLKDSGCGIFVYAGSTPNTELYSGQLSLDNGYIVTNAKMETSLPGVYAAGDICVKQVRQAATAVSDGAVAAVNAAM